MVKAIIYFETVLASGPIEKMTCYDLVECKHKQSTFGFVGRKVAGLPMVCRGTLIACQVRAQSVPVACHVCAKAQGWRATPVPLRASTVPGLCLWPAS